MRAMWWRMRAALRSFWTGLRQWCGDSAYETYLAYIGKRGATPLSAREFYVEQLNRKYSRPSRCC